METEKVSDYFPYLHYNSTENAIDKNMESVLRRRADYNNTKLVYVLDKDIRFTDINIDYAIAHPYIYTIEIYNNQRTKLIDSIISVDSETKKRTMHVRYLSRSNVTDDFEKRLDYKYDIDQATVALEAAFEDIDDAYDDFKDNDEYWDDY